MASIKSCFKFDRKSTNIKVYEGIKNIRAKQWWETIESEIESVDIKTINKIKKGHYIKT